MTPIELMRIVDPNTIYAYLGSLKKEGVITHKWRISASGNPKNDRLFILRAPSKHGETVLGGFPSITYIEKLGWLAIHVVLRDVSNKVIRIEEEGRNVL